MSLQRRKLLLVRHWISEPEVTGSLARTRRRLRFSFSRGRKTGLDRYWYAVEVCLGPVAQLVRARA
jgi:hypothetical protein